MKKEIILLSLVIALLHCSPAISQRTYYGGSITASLNSKVNFALKNLELNAGSEGTTITMFTSFTATGVTEALKLLKDMIHDTKGIPLTINIIDLNNLATSKQSVSTNQAVLYQIAISELHVDSSSAVTVSIVMKSAQVSVSNKITQDIKLNTSVAQKMILKKNFALTMSGISGGTITKINPITITKPADINSYPGTEFTIKITGDASSWQNWYNTKDARFGQISIKAIDGNVIAKIDLKSVEISSYNTSINLGGTSTTVGLKVKAAYIYIL